MCESHPKRFRRRKTGRESQAAMPRKNINSNGRKVDWVRRRRKKEIEVVKKLLVILQMAKHNPIDHCQRLVDLFFPANSFLRNRRAPMQFIISSLLGLI